MKIATIAVRLLLGLAFAVFGADFFFHFLPQPKPEGAAGELAGAMYNSGYLFHAVKLIELAGGILLLSGLFTPLALTLLAPIVVNIVLFNLFLTPPSAWGPPALVTILEVFLIWRFFAYFRPLLTVRAVQS